MSQNSNAKGSGRLCSGHQLACRVNSIGCRIDFNQDVHLEDSLRSFSGDSRIHPSMIEGESLVQG